jgi:small subunit ribosomal protein S20
MAHSKQAKKRILQNEKARIANKVRRSTMKTAIKKAMAAIEAGDKKQAEALAREACQKIDKAAKNSVIHANAAARQKSGVMRRVAAMK